jgi:hypothetical protein
MELTTAKLDTSWSPPKASDLGGPEQLADCMIDFRHWHATKGLHSNGGVNDENLRRLVKLAYFASQTSDEGRYPHFRLFCPSPGWRDAIEDLRILRYSQPRFLSDVNSIRRLAPSVDSHDRALLIVEEPVGLVCDGIVAVTRPTHLGPPQQGAWPRPEGLMVRVDGPGALHATEAGLTFVLRAGTVRNLIPYHLIDPVKSWLSQLSGTLLARCLLPGDKGSHSGGTSLRMLLISLWADVLSSTLDLHHGGAFIVVPEPAAAPLVRKTEVLGLNLGSEIEAYWKSRMLAEQEHENYVGNALQTCHKQWHRLVTRAKAVAHLSAVDGCVVLDRELRVDSFGAVIHVDAPRSGECKQPDLDYWTHEPIPVTESAGTRHAAARNLCSVLPGAFAFVVSQDGDLTLFFSNTRGVYRAGPLSAADGPDW